MSNSVTNNLRRSIYIILEPQSNEDVKQHVKLSHLVDIFLIILIALNVLAVIIETVPAINAQYQQEFYYLEIFSVIVFTIEYLLRIWSCVEGSGHKGTSFTARRIKYVKSPMAIIDFLAVAPFYLSFFIAVDLRFLRILRLLRIFKLTRYSAAMTTLLNVLKEESRNFGAAIVIMMVIMVISASCIYLVEHEQQPEAFGSIPQSMWWAIVTLTTVGYGDVTPITLLGKVFAAAIMLAGVGLVALPTGILASSFSEHIKRKRETLALHVNEALEDGIIDQHEQAHLRELSQKLGISDEALQQLQQRISEKISHATRYQHCPHCGHAIAQPRINNIDNTENDSDESI